VIEGEKPSERVCVREKHSEKERNSVRERESKTAREREEKHSEGEGGIQRKRYKQ
jgi:hypothetical protein